ncbi:sugar-binding transcriptional regulator [Roseinatronobacter monicus]|uniref:DNA-binding transcriptional regulator LsrR (DeoR family) n=1 Tax=Roseinatronobacter monicus TaxID=393481 RepID=A0A543K3K3_9RHOB|nr:sugar-binding transcriptional regulator [Roseinatronobacter monicus]TQM89660.1 DNA-binding transcriptional regulator LsrR (DeoR family) [Roseinatronobacter monicus]
MNIDTWKKDITRDDEAARAGWLYYVGRMTQDQIADTLGISRQRAQRLVTRAVSAGLVHVRLEHRLSSCLRLEAELTRRFGLKLCRVAPSLAPDADPVPSIAVTAATELEHILQRSEPLVVALGTGRAMRATVDELTSINCPQHKLVSLSGNIAPDGLASLNEVIMRIAGRIRAAIYPMPVPVIAASVAERDGFHALAPVQNVLTLARNANVTFLGIGQMDNDAALFTDGFISRAELSELQAHGAAGELAGWVYDGQGRYLTNGTNTRVAGAEVGIREDNLVVAVAGGRPKQTAILGALRGRLINGIVTDEDTAERVLRKS